jgi:hypothetical protein
MNVHELGGVYLAGQPSPEGLAEARTVGLRSEGYVEKAKHYVQRITAGNYEY